MQTDPLDEKVICFVCNYGLFLLVIIFVLVFGLWRFQSQPPRPIMPPPLAPTAEPLVQTPVPPSLPATENSGNLFPSPLPTISIQPEMTFTLAFISLNWQGSRAAFEQAARAHAQNFSVKSGIPLQIQIIFLEQSLDNQDLSDPDLIHVVISHAAENNIIADRYIGLTDGDLRPEGLSDVVGWTSGEQGLVVESVDPHITTHELGHTFGLCDEYSYSDWTRQDSEYSDGCPNPYPENCSKDLTSGAICDGTPAEDGQNSMMGPAGLPGDYAFNRACLDHLQTVFQLLLGMQEATQ